MAQKEANEKHIEMRIRVFLIQWPKIALFFRLSFIMPCIFTVFLYSRRPLTLLTHSQESALWQCRFFGTIHNIPFILFVIIFVSSKFMLNCFLSL